MISLSKAMTTDEKIDSIVKRYQALPRDFNSPESLTYAQQQLVCLLWDYVKEVGELYELSKGAEAARKVAFEREKLRLIGENESVAAADAKAKEAISSMVFSEIEADVRYKAASLRLTAARDVYQAIYQHISSLKQEKRFIMQGGA